MSLINEALKKAQRQRNEAAAANPGEGGPVAKRAEPKSAKSMVLIGLGVLVLVVIAIAATALWITRPISHPAATVAKTKPATPAAPATVSAAPMLVMPAIKPAAAPAEPVARMPKPSAPPSLSETPSTAPTPPPVAASPQPAAADSATGPAASVPDITTNAPAAREVAPAPATPQPDERIRQFVDSVRVTGVRSSGADSKVLMNDRVYRVNQIVNPDLGVRLTKVANDSLTFTDRNGVEYVKYF